MIYNELTHDNNLSIIDAIVEYFSLIYVVPQPPDTMINGHSSIFLSNVFEGLKNMGLDNAYEPHKLPSIVSSNCCYALACPYIYDSICFLPRILSRYMGD